MNRFTLKGLLSLFVLLVCSLASVKAQDIRISEFLVTNTTGIQDNDGTLQGWIELWNPSRTTKYNLSGWKLWDGSVLEDGVTPKYWVLPSIEILPDDRLLIWASGKNRKVVTAPLHTDFTLSPAGGILQLIRPAGTIASEFAGGYPAQTPDVSYGQDASEPKRVGFYHTPTPEEPNNFSGPGVSGKVAYSIPSGAFTSSFQLALSQVAPVEGAEIRYTINGTIPTSTSTLYTGPINVSGTTQVRARVFTPGLLPGEADSECYLLIDASISNFSSKIPVVVLTNFNAGRPVDGNGSPAENLGYAWVFEPTTDGTTVTPTRITNAPTIRGRVAMDRRGSSTLDNPKYNLNIEFRKARGEEERNVELLGMPSHSDWVFHAPYFFDPSLVHNPFMYALSNSIGRYASRTRMAEVFVKFNAGTSPLSYSTVNDVSGFPVSGYMGVYNIMEKIRRGKDRVNIKSIGRYDNDNVGKTGGYIVKVDRRDQGDAGFNTPHEAPGAGEMTNGFAYYYPKEIDLISPQRDPQEQFVKSRFNAFDSSCYAGNYKDPVNGYRKYLDVPAAIDHHLMNVWSLNVDGMRLSGYIHLDRWGKITYGPVWDFDRALCSQDGRDTNPLVWRSTTGDLGTNFFNYTWWKQLFLDADFYQAYIDRWAELRRGQFSPESVNALLDRLNSEITPEAALRDQTRWGQGKRSWTSPFTKQTFSGQTAEIQRIKDWLQQRANFMDSQWVGGVTVTPAGGNVPPGTEVTMSGPAGATIYYTLDGSDPRPSGGAVPSSSNVKIYDPVANTPIIVTATTRIRARAYKASHAPTVNANTPPAVSKWGARTDARFSTDLPAGAGNLIITELNYHPTNPTTAELAANPLFSDSDFEFVELKNIGTTPIDLAGAQFTAGISFAFTGEQAISLAPGEIAILAANPQAFAARYGEKPNVLGPFEGELANGGERLLLVNAASEPILDFTYDDAWYPLTDGAGQSLVVYNQTAPASAFSTAENWRASVAVSGSPGSEEAPFVTTLAATEISATSVKLNATVSTNGLLVTPKFVLSNFDVPDDLPAIPAGSGTVAVEKAITGLSPHTLYTFRVEATNAVGGRVGEDVSFTTLNRPPEAHDKSLLHASTRDAFIVDFLSTDSDPDGDELTISAVTQGEHGAVTISDDKKTVLYTPNPEYNGNDSFSYTISDGFEGTATATVTLHNSLPVPAGDVVIADRQAVTFNPLENDSDPDSTDVLRISSVTQGSAGTVTITDAGTLTYTPGPQYFGRDLFTYTITDGSAFTSATVAVRNSVPVVVSGPFKGMPVGGQPGDYGNIDLPVADVFSGEVQNGRVKQRAIFAADGSVLLKVGDPAPGIDGATIATLGRITGQTVVATVKGPKGSGITGANDTVLYSGFADGSVRILAREGMTSFGGATLKSFISVDGNGASVFFLAKLAGKGVKANNDTALCVVEPQGEARVLVREGDLVEGKSVTSIATLVFSAGTQAEGRWRSGPDAIGVRLSFPRKAQGLYTIPATATSVDAWTRWAQTGEAYSELAAAQTFGLPGFGPGGLAFTAQLMRVPRTITAANDQVLVKLKADGARILAGEGGTVPGVDGQEIFGLKFQKFSDPVVGAGGRTAFIATIAGGGITAANRTGLWLEDASGAVKLLARAGDSAPDGSRWAAFESMVFPDGEKSGPLFTAKLIADATTPKNSRALWAVDSSGGLQRLLRTGEVIVFNDTERTVKSFVALTPTSGTYGAASGFDDDQHVTAFVSFEDGAQGLIDIAIP